jgi:hypothetical protein
MIQINFTEPTDTIWTRWRRECDEETPKYADVIKTRKAPEISKLYRRQSIKERYYFNPEGPFRGKCAYCETYLTHFQNPDVEHFRPKLGVTDEKDVAVTIDYGWGSVTHLGYFWLAYDWRNLLPSCVKCNQASDIAGEKIGKHNRFPVTGSHARSDTEVGTEQPLLLHPVHDEPEKHLRVNTSDGMMEPRDGSRRGLMTIHVFGLNVRDQLKERRYAKVLEVKALFTQLLHDATSRQAVLTKIEAMRAGQGEYVAAVRSFFEEFGPVLSALTGSSK